VKIGQFRGGPIGDQRRGPGGLLWVTNVATPYRAPLWAALGERHDLTVALLADSEPNRSWKVALDRSRYSVVSLQARTLTSSGGSTIYGPSRQLMELIARRPRAVVLDGWESPAFLTARWWAKHHGVPVIASYRSTLSTHRFNAGPVSALRRWFFRGADLVLTAGQASTEAVTAMGVPLSSIVEGFNTVDVDRFSVGAAKVRAAQPDRPGHHFLYVGQFIPRKNVESLIIAFASMRDPDDTLTLVGGGPLENDFRVLGRFLEIENALTFLGNLDGDDLVTAYGMANTLVLPSTEEVWGLVVNEGLAAGLHAVVSTACGITRSIDQMPGVITTGPNARDIEEALCRSRLNWDGPLIDHPVTRHTPLALSTVVLSAMERVSRNGSEIQPGRL
jgi:glycosyltransferase involved in cell wall biosynthesis